MSIREAWLPSCPSQRLMFKTYEYIYKKNYVKYIIRLLKKKKTTVRYLDRVTITCTVRKLMEIKLYTRITMTARP